MAVGRYSEKSNNRNTFAVDWPILTKFGIMMHLGSQTALANII